MYFSPPRLSNSSRVRRLAFACLLATVIPAANTHHSYARAAGQFVVVGIGTANGNLLTVAATVGENESDAPAGIVQLHRSSGDISIVLDCGQVDVIRSNVFGVSHFLFASGLGDNGTRYFLRIVVAGDTVGAQPAYLGTTPDETAPCDAAPTENVALGPYTILP